MSHPFDWTIPTRIERFAFEQLDTRLNRVGALAGVTGCSLDWNIHNTIRGSGDLDVRTSRSMVWPQVIVRPWVVVSNRTGQKVVPLMTAVCKVPDETITPRGVEVQVQLHDLTMLLDQLPIGRIYKLGTTTPITTAIKQIFASLGITNVNVVDSTRTLSETRFWWPNRDEPISWLRVLNDLLVDHLGYFGVWTDPLGIFQCTPYRAPSEREVLYRFADDGRSYRYAPNVGMKHGEHINVNRWEYWSKSTETVESFSYILENRNPAHPYSIPNSPLGVPVVKRKSGLEGNVWALVERDKAEDMADQRTFEVPARFVPVVEHDAVELVNAAGGINTRATVAGRSLDCKRGALLQLTLREVL